MAKVNATLLILGFIPIGAAWWGCRWRALAPTFIYALAPWGMFCYAAMAWPHSPWPIYIGLTLAGCVGISVFGARYPMVHAWIAVIAALAAVQLIPAGFEWLLRMGGPDFVVGELSLYFMIAVWFIGIANYLPTRIGLAAFLLIVAFGSMSADLIAAKKTIGRFTPAHIALALVPWLAWLLVATRRKPANPVDELWLEFRDHFGVVWGQRVREQFNASAKNAGYDVVLRWSGLDGCATDHEPLLEILRKIVRKFREPM